MNVRMLLDFVLFYSARICILENNLFQKLIMEIAETFYNYKYKKYMFICT